jgi:hypothetical protein
VAVAVIVKFCNMGTTPSSRPKPIPRGIVEGEDSHSRYRDNEEMWDHLEQDGYIVVPGVVDAEVIDKALRVINRSLGKYTPIREKMCPDCGSLKGMYGR